MVKMRSSDANLAVKISRALTGQPPKARQSRRLGNSDCHCKTVSSAVTPMASAISKTSSVRMASRNSAGVARCHRTSYRSQ